MARLSHSPSSRGQGSGKVPVSGLALASRDEAVPELPWKAEHHVVTVDVFVADQTPRENPGYCLVRRLLFVHEADCGRSMPGTPGPNRPGVL